MKRIGFESRVFILSSAHHAPYWFAGGSLPEASKATTVEEGEAGRAGWTVRVKRAKERDIEGGRKSGWNLEPP